MASVSSCTDHPTAVTDALDRRMRDDATLRALMECIAQAAVRLLDPVCGATVMVQLQQRFYMAHDVQEVGTGAMRSSRSAFSMAPATTGKLILVVPLRAHGRSVGALCLFGPGGRTEVPDPDILQGLTNLMADGLGDFEDGWPYPSMPAVLRRTAAEWSIRQNALPPATDGGRRT